LSEKKTGLELLREPFPAHHISKLPKGTKAQNECPPDQKVNCEICGGRHHPKIIHLDYVGHAALTDRLLDCDLLWSWEPVAFGQDGLPAIDKIGGLWIRLTVCGRSMLGYGHPDGKTGGNAIKEAIGDALRNAAMRLGAALDLWHKGDLHLDEEELKDVELVNATDISAIRTALVARGTDEVKFCEYYGIAKIDDIPKEKYASVLSALSKKPK
jgi:hypothetical protein